MGEIFKAEKPRATMAHTGERLSAGHSLETEVEHFHRYYMARHFCRDMRVLDIASGEGYGSALIAQVASSVIGVDVDQAAVDHASISYVRGNLSFRQGSATDIPVDDCSIDVLVSFETLEHFVDHDRFMSEARRILRPGGKLILSTPDRDIFSPVGAPATEFHVHELTRVEFATLLSRYFANCAFFSQRVMVGSAILRDDGDPARVPPMVFERRGDTHIEMCEGIPRARYRLCVASDANDDLIAGGLFIDTSNLADPTGRTGSLERELQRTRDEHRRDTETIQREHDALVQRIDRDRTEQVTEIDRRHGEELAAAHTQREDIAALRASEGELEAALRQASQRIAAVEQQGRDARSDAEQVKGRLAEATASLAHARAELASGAWRERQLHARQAELAAQVAAQVAAQAGVAQSLRQVTAAHDAVLRSGSWRLLARAQRVATRFPRAARAARTGAKLAFWTATLQLRRRTRARRQAHADGAILAATPLFDRAWYLTRYKEVAAAGIDPVMHYHWTGAAVGYNPHPLFDTAWYLATYPAVGRAGENPLAHYIRTGNAAGHDPHPLFDSACYLGGHPRPTSGTVLEHYLAHTGTPLSPNAMFDPNMYLAEYPAARVAGADALLHYVTAGADLGFAPHPLFDARWYATRYPGSADFPADPAIRALGHFLRVGLAAGNYPSVLLEKCEVAFWPGMKFAFPETESPDVSIVIPAYAHLHETFRCLCAVLWRTGSLSYEVILADDKPDAAIVPMLAQFTRLRTRINHTNLGFLRNCNEAARIARGRHLLFLNNDTEVGADWLAPMLRIADRGPAVGMVGCKLLNADGTIQEAGGIFRNDGWGEPYGRGDDATHGEYNFVRDVDCVTGACFLVPRQHWLAVGGFDDGYAPAFYEEFDLAVALQEAGLRVVYQPASEVTHHGSASYGTEMRDRQSSINHRRFRRKWARYLTTRPLASDGLFTARDSRHYAGVALVIDDKVPEHDRHAGGLTLHQYVTLLHDLGLKVVYCPADLAASQPYTGALQQRGIEVVLAPDTMQAWLSRNGRHVDRVWIARPSIASAWIEALRRETGAPILYYTHDLHYLREMRRFELEGDWWAREESTRLKRVEFDIFARADVVMSPSGEEAAIVRREVPTATVRAIPPYLFASSDNPPPPLTAEDFAARRDIVFVGGYDHPPNVDAAIWLADEIFPLIQARVPQARLVILGNRPPPSVTALASDHVRITGYVADLAPYYADARMSLSPLRYGAGVKGKVVGSLQAGVPVVTTPIGSEGIGLRDGEDALIGNTAAEIAACAIRLFEDPELCARLAASGEAVVRERFSIEGATKAMRALFGLDG